MPVIRSPSDAAGMSAKLTALENEISHLFERVPFGSHSISVDGTFLTVNALELAWLGYTREELIGKKKLSDFLSPQSRIKYNECLHGENSPTVVSELELELIRRDGSSMTVSLSSMGRTSADNKTLSSRALMFDMSDSRQQKVNQRIAATAFESLSGMFVTNVQKVIVQVNSAFTLMTGYSAEEAIGQTPRLLSSGRHENSFYQAMWAQIKEQGVWQGEIWNRRKNGEVFLEWLSISTVYEADGAVSHYVASFSDITASKDAQSQILFMADHDALTNLPNRRLLQDRLSQALATSKRHGIYGALQFIDLDNFKTVNDTCGHEAGDLLLVEAGMRLRSAVREGDTVARLGGDEFAIILEALDSDLVEAASVAQYLSEKLLGILAQPYHFRDYEFRCTGSIGVEMFTGTESPSELIQHADLAMYQAKRAGRNAVQFFDQKMQQSLNTRVAMEAEIRQALLKQEFVLYLQPQISQKRGIIGAEVLLRWVHPTRGIISPNEFISLAEETGLILPMGQWVLEAAAAQLKCWEIHPVLAQLQLSVNVSAHQFHQADFVARVQQTLAKHEVQPDRIKLEITESMVLDVDDIVSKMNALRAVGVSFAMDDFGTGYSSLSILTKLPLRQLKIDQSFVRNVSTKPADAAIVQTIIAMAKTLEFEVLAEGVETDEQRLFLTANGCELQQGYFFGRPTSITEFESLVMAPSQSSETR